MKVPKSLQPVLWSVRTEELDLKEDKVYIIHQILSFGNLKELRWLFRNYSIKEIKEVFLKYPIKVYRPQSFNFVNQVLLKIRNKKLNIKRYVPATL
jgi:hypothetical protein